MTVATRKPLIVQGDSTLLLDVHDPGFESARAEIAPFAELEKSPEHMHTYRMTPLSLWNAASAGITAESVLTSLSAYSRYPVPENVAYFVTDTISRYGKIRLSAVDVAQDAAGLDRAAAHGEAADGDEPVHGESGDGLPGDRLHPRGRPDDGQPVGGGVANANLLLTIEDSSLYAEIESHKKVSRYLRPYEGPEGTGFLVALFDRGTIKQELMRLGYPVKDEAPLVDGDSYPLTFRDTTGNGASFSVRDYQREAASAFLGNRRPGTGFGTVVLPCGAGKTVVGMAVMSMLKTSTLILTTNVAAVHQWIDELTDKTGVPREDIGEYTGDRKEVRPITVGTYQILVWRSKKDGDYPHFRVFRDRKWGLIIYDEVHLLPAPVFRATAEIQAVRRLGLTATLVREDGREDDVFSLVGPKRYDVPWKELESKGWIAEANCYEIRADLPEDLKIPYATADKRQKFRIASENPLKLEIARQIIQNHPEDAILVIGQYLNQLYEIAKELDAPIITGKTPNQERERIYHEFRKGTIRVIVVSKVANFAIDLPDASVAIQISGTFGSRQEEAQRLGRILRPKKKNSYFYSIVSRYTSEEVFSANRQKFLTEQGYRYHIEAWSA